MQLLEALLVLRFECRLLFVVRAEQRGQVAQHIGSPFIDLVGMDMAFGRNLATVFSSFKSSRTTSALNESE